VLTGVLNGRIQCCSSKIREQHFWTEITYRRTGLLPICCDVFLSICLTMFTC